MVQALVQGLAQGRYPLLNITEGLKFMTCIHDAIVAGHLEWALYALSLLVSALPDAVLSMRLRGFGRRGFGFGRGRGLFGLFRLLRILFLLLFTTVLGPIVVVVVIVFATYWFFTSRRG